MRFLALIPITLAIQGATVKNIDAVPIPFTQSPSGFTAHGRGLTIELTRDAAFVLINKATLPIRVVNASALSNPAPIEPLPGKANFLIGNDSSKWRKNVPTYGKVAYRGVLPGVDLLYYGNEKRLEYDFEVAPGADPSRIELEIGAGWKASVTKDGALLMKSADGAKVEFAKPVTYQMASNGDRMPVESAFKLRSDNRFGFRVGAYDKSRKLVIDPVLVYGTYLGGSSLDIATAVAVDSAGSAYVTGMTQSANFPISASAFLKSCNANGVPPINGVLCASIPNSVTYDTYAFVTKFNPQGTQIVYSTYIGGGQNIDSNLHTQGYSVGSAIAVDGSGSAYITGTTLTLQFPVTPNAYQLSKRPSV